MHRKYNIEYLKVSLAVAQNYQAISLEDHRQLRMAQTLAKQLSSPIQMNAKHRAHRLLVVILPYLLSKNRQGNQQLKRQPNYEGIIIQVDPLHYALHFLILITSSFKA